MHFTTRSFLGHTDPNSWSQFWENEPDDPVITIQRGHLFGLINLSLNEDEDASAIGHELIEKLNSKYFETSDLNTKDWLLQTMDAVASQYLPQCSHLTLLLAVSLNQHLYLVSYNSGQMVFNRGSQISTILKSTTAKSEVVIGQPQDGDQLLLSTYAFSQAYSWDKIKGFLRSGKIQEIEENFLSELYTLPDQSRLAGAVIQFHQDDVTPVYVDEVEAIDSPPESIDEPLPTPIPTASKFEFVKNIFTRQSRGDYITHLDSNSQSRRRRLNIIFSLLVLLALGTSIVYSFRRNQQSQTETKYQSLRGQFDSKIQNANAIKNINLGDAQKLAHDAASIIKEMSALKIHSDEISRFSQQTQTLLSQTGSSDAYQPTKFYDTTLIAKDSQYSQLILVKNNLYLLDTNAGRVDMVDIVQKSKQSIGITPDLKGVQSFAVDNDHTYVLKDKEIFQVESKSLTSKIKLPEKLSDLSSGIIRFWNGSLYLLALTTDSPTIWKFTPNSSGFDSGAVWLKSTESLPSNPTSMAINGQIWIVSQTGTIAPYTHGAKTEFSAKTGNSYTNIANLVTAPDSDYLAFTEAGNQVYVYKKSGESILSYNFGSKKILSLALDQTSNSIFVLCADQQIYKISL